MRNLLFASLLFTLFCTSCASTKNGTKAISVTQMESAIDVDSGEQSYNMQFDFLKKHFSGLLMTKKLKDGEIRVVYSSHFGMSLFDFGFKNDSMTVYHCIEPLKKGKILKLLNNDLQLVLGLKRGQKFKLIDTGNAKYGTTGTLFGRIKLEYLDYHNKYPNHMLVNHPLIRLKLTFDKIIE